MFKRFLVRIPGFTEGVVNSSRIKNHFRHFKHFANVYKDWNSDKRKFTVTNRDPTYFMTCATIGDAIIKHATAEVFVKAYPVPSVHGNMISTAISNDSMKSFVRNVLCMTEARRGKALADTFEAWIGHISKTESKTVAFHYATIYALVQLQMVK